MTAKRKVLLSALGAALVFGLVCILAAATGPAALRTWTAFGSLVSAVLMASWCQEDSRPRGIRVGKPSLWLIVLLGPVGLLAYLFRSRPPSRALLSFLLYILFVGLLLAFVLGGVILGVLITEAMGWNIDP